MVVIGHQTVGMHLPIDLLASLRQRLDEILAVNVIEEDLLGVVAPAHYMIRCPWIFHEQFARCGVSQSNLRAGCQVTNELSYGLTPLLTPLPLPLRQINFLISEGSTAVFKHLNDHFPPGISLISV